MKTVSIRLLTPCNVRMYTRLADHTRGRHFYKIWSILQSCDTLKTVTLQNQYTATITGLANALQKSRPDSRGTVHG